MRGMTMQQTWDASLHPRIGTGQFTGKDHTSPEGGLTFADPALFDAIDETYPVPQADNLEAVSATVLAVAADVNTASSVAQALEVDERQGGYYLNAAGYLGLVEADHAPGAGATLWRLTSLGEHLTRLDDDERAARVAALAECTPAVAAYRDRGPGGAADAIAERAELSEDTIGRRAATAERWAKAIDAADYLTSEARTAGAARDRFAQAAAAAKQERLHAPSTPKAAVYCPDCFTAIPATGVCGSFLCA